MGPSPGTLTALVDAFSGITAALADMLLSRLELASLEAKEAAVRLVQVLLLAGLGCGFLVLSLGLGLFAVILATPPAWRAAVAGGGAALALLVGLVALVRMRTRLVVLSNLFAESVATLKKDKECF